MPPTVVAVVMKIGRTRDFTAVTMASVAGMGFSPNESFPRMKLSDCSTIRIALFTTVPMRMTKPSMVSTSSCWGAMVGLDMVQSCTRRSPRKPPTVARGTESMMTRG